MKLYQKFLAIAISAMSLMQTAYAEQQFVRINGFAEEGAIGVVTLMVDKGANLKELQPQQIRWIDQAKIAENGAFSVYLPVYDSDEYDFYSNAISYDKEEAELCYKGLKKVLGNKPNWSLFLITSHKGFEKFYGKEADKRRKLYNGMLKCYVYQYFK